MNHDKRILIPDGGECTYDPASAHLEVHQSLLSKAASDLATAIHCARSSHPVISWEAQQEAAEFMNRHGLGATIAEIKRLAP